MIPVTSCEATHRCSPRHPPHIAPVRCSPRHPPHSVLVLAASSTTQCAGARHIIHHIVYRCSPRQPPHSVRVPVLDTSSITQCSGAPHTDDVADAVRSSMGRFRYIARVNCPDRVAVKATALRAGKRASGRMPIQSCRQSDIPISAYWSLL